MIPKAAGGKRGKKNCIRVCRECHVEIHKHFGPGDRYRGPYDRAKLIAAMRKEDPMRVEMSGFKGGDESWDGPSRVLVTGPNGSGKTRLIQAVQVALLGEVPALGKRALAGLLTPGREGFTVGVDIAGVKVERRFEVTATGGLGGEQVRLNDGPWQSLRKAEAELRRIAGSSAVSLDVGALIRMTPGQRAGELMSHLPLMQAGPEVVLQTIEDPHPELVALVNRAWQKGASLAENLGRVSELLAQKVSASRANRDAAEAQVQGLKEQLRGLPPASDTPAGLRHDAQVLEAEAKGLRAQLHLAQQQALDRANRERILEELRAAEAETLQTLEEQEVQLDLARQVLASAGTERDLTLPEKVSEAFRLVEERIQALEAAVRDVAKAERDLAVAEARCAALHKGAQAIHGDGVTTCPTCQQSVGEIERDYLLSVIDEARCQRDAAEDAVRTAVAIRLSKANAKCNADAELKRLESLWQSHVERERNASTAFGNAERLVEASTKRLETLRGRLADMTEAPLPEDAEPLSVDAISARLSEISEKLAKIREDLQRESTAQERRNAAAKAEEALARHSEDWARARSMQAAFKAGPAALIDKALSGLTESASQILAHVQPGWRFVVDAQSGIEFVAVSAGGERLPLGSLSGGESALFAAALAVAVIRLTNPPVKVLMLEAAEVDDDRLPALCEILSTIGHDMDQILVATCHECEAPAGWEVRHLGAAMEVEA